MGSPIPLATLLLVYLVAVLKVLPKYMADRKPFDLKQIIKVYNIFQVLACSWLVMKAFQYGFTFKNTWKCINIIDTNEPIDKASIGWIYLYWYAFLVRVAELIETVFFSLRKKQNQVSILHVYHHVSTIIFVWSFFKFSCEMTEIYIAVINSLIHIIMYSYYLLSTYKVLDKYLKVFKPILTSMQLIQFVVIFGQCIVALMPSCQSSKIIFGAMLADIVFLFYMFGDFFIKNYTKKSK
ncbi:unnamed protein product [Diamesa serratosioi]